MFTLYKASAGSGKTSRLVVEYLALCLPQPEKFKHVIAITFTNNATAEMKSRIVDTLFLLAFEPEITPESSVFHTYNQIVAKIAAHLPLHEQSQTLKTQSKILLEKILYEYDRFSISTIDSFFQRILRAFAIEFELPPQFNLEIEWADFFKETTAVLLQRISKNNIHLTKRVLDLVENVMLEKGKWKIESEILKLLRLSTEEEVGEPLKKLQESENTNFEQAKKKVSREIQFLKSQLKAFVTKEEKKSEDYLLLSEKLLEYEFFGKNLFQLALLFDLKTIMDEIKAQDSLFFLSETNAKINEKLSDQDVPFIYEKIGNQYSYFFIDEFQDTSKLQWENILPLIKNALSGNNKFNEQGKVFLFGDVKQAIYRFRNGDAEIIQQLSTIEGYRTSVLPYAQPEIDYRVELLDTNFRSSRKVIEFNNTFFNYLTSEGAPFCEARVFYEDVTQKCKPTAEEGAVTVLFQDDEDVQKFRDFIQTPVLNTIFDALQRGFSYKDIAVLVSGNDLAGAVGAFLMANNIPIISTESLKLSASPEVNLIIATLQYILSADDKLAKLAIVHYLTQLHKLPFEEYITCVQSEALFQQFLSTLRIHLNNKELNSIPLFTLLHEICRIFSLSLYDSFIVRLFDECENFSTKGSYTIPLFLLWWEEKGQSLSLSTPQGIDAVTVSTIHKAKGLEYPVVVLPFSRYGNIKTKPDIFVQDQVTGLEYDWVTLTKDKTPLRYQPAYFEESRKTLVDQLNKLYVAHTRARTELHIITEKPSAKLGNYSKFLNLCLPFLAPYLSEPPTFEATISHSQRSEESFTNQKSKKVVSKGISLPNFLNSTSVQQQRGVFIHHYLSSLTTFPQNQAEIETTTQNVQETYREELVAIFNKILGNKRLHPYFTPNVKVLNETSILFPSGKIVRPDRVVFLEDKAVVIDYKTGSPHTSHQEQIDRYCDAIREMGYGKVVGEVLYF